MVDYTCRGGELRMEFRAEENHRDIDVRCLWDNSNAHHVDTNWARIKEIAHPYLIDSQKG
jgi:hypothetical protein